MLKNLEWQTTQIVWVRLDTVMPVFEPEIERAADSPHLPQLDQVVHVTMLVTERRYCGVVAQPHIRLAHPKPPCTQNFVDKAVLSQILS